MPNYTDVPAATYSPGHSHSSNPNNTTLPTQTQTSENKSLGGIHSAPRTYSTTRLYTHPSIYGGGGDAQASVLAYHKIWPRAVDGSTAMNVPLPTSSPYPVRSFISRDSRFRGSAFPYGVLEKPPALGYHYPYLRLRRRPAAERCRARLD